MNQPVRFGRFDVLPPVVKNLLIINGLFFVATYILENKFGIDLAEYLGLFYWTSGEFRPHQVVTHMFMHGSVGHILLNMFALWMFGSVLENIWGSQRFLVFYLITGIGAALFYNLTQSIEIHFVSQHLSPEMIEEVKREGFSILQKKLNYSDPYLGSLNAKINMPVVGASGAVYGLLMAFGMLFPNSYLYLYLLVPVKAKYVVGGLMIYALVQGLIDNPSDNVAHFAHLGGALIAYLIIKYWNKNNRKSFF